MTMLAQIIYSLVALALRILDGVFCICHSLCQEREQTLPDTDTWSDEDIIQAVESAPFLEGSDERLVQISEDTVVKLCDGWDSTISEALAMDLVRKQTRIPVPHMSRTIRHPASEDGLIVMDLVQNSQRFQVTWPELSIWRNILRTTIDPVHWAKPLNAATVFSSALIDTKGPFPTISDLEAYFRKEHRAAEARASRGVARSPNCKPLTASAFASLMFTHNDLNMRNLLLDKNHVLWVVDWGFSGFYPPWFEYIGMRHAAQKDKDPKSWQQCIKYMAEPAFEIEEWMKRIGYDANDIP